MDGPWFKSNSKLHRELDFPSLKYFINTLIHNFHYRLSLVTSAVHYRVGQRTTRPSLKQKLY